MSDPRAFKALSLLTTVFVGGLIAAACSIHLRGDEAQPISNAPVAREIDPVAAAELERCRAVTYEQKDRLTECRKLWTEQRRQFLDPTRKSVATPAKSEPSTATPPLVKDQGRLPSELFPAPMKSER